MSGWRNNLQVAWLNSKQYAATLWFKDEEECVLCGNRSEDVVCADCRERYLLTKSPRCIACGKIIPIQKQVCRDCESGNGPQGLRKVTALGHYHGALKDYIHRIKFKSQPYHLLALADDLVSWVINVLPPPDALVPIPMHPARLAQRGYNQAEVLASILSRRLGIDIKDMLLRNRETLSQTALGRRERLKNLQGAFTLKPNFGKHIHTVWLVDDVVTTGATLEECSKALKTGGIDNIYAVCLGAGKEE
ncbi:ComF family protein [Dehalobacter sp. DCM]|uniref:ComF family protein n=1 Tax=Dehalobacter sp. DCM TaxID=2907827 RepID=UPI003081695B|nr:ComF family protein [Dehalobacter sp. DCM]